MLCGKSRYRKHNTVRRISAFRGNCNSGAILARALRARMKLLTCHTAQRIRWRSRMDQGSRHICTQSMSSIPSWTLPTEHLLSSIGRPPHDRQSAAPAQAVPSPCSHVPRGSNGGRRILFANPVRDAPCESSASIFFCIASGSGASVCVGQWGLPLVLLHRSSSGERHAGGSIRLSTTHAPFRISDVFLSAPTASWTTMTPGSPLP